MAVYTHFGGMPGLWQAVRQEGFLRLSDRLNALAPTDDPVCDLAALSSAYTANALEHPALYRTMFDASVDLEDAAVADTGFSRLIEAATRARAAGRFGRRTDPAAYALRHWATGHGIISLVLTGVLPRAALDEHVPPMMVALLVAAGDREDRARRSVARGWSIPAD